MCAICGAVAQGGAKGADYANVAPCITPLPSHRFLGSLSVMGEEALYCIAPTPTPEDDEQGLRVWRWLPWADALPKQGRWREQCGERAHRVLAMWAESVTAQMACGHPRAVEQTEQVGSKAPKSWCMLCKANEDAGQEQARADGAEAEVARLRTNLRNVATVIAEGATPEARAKVFSVLGVEQ